MDVELKRITDEVSIDMLELIANLQRMNSKGERLGLLGERYPDLCIFVM